MRKISYAPKEDRFLTRGPRETPDILAGHHPQCSVKTKRETEGDEESGGKRKEAEREKEGGGGEPRSAGVLTVLSIEAVEGALKDLGGLDNSCRRILNTHTYLYTLGLLQTSWVTHSKHALTDDSLFFYREAKR